MRNSLTNHDRRVPEPCPTSIGGIAQSVKESLRWRTGTANGTLDKATKNQNQSLWSLCPTVHFGSNKKE